MLAGGQSVGGAGQVGQLAGAGVGELSGMGVWGGCKVGV